MKGSVDFSAKHDVLIRHKDGTLTPMDEPYYEVTKIGEDTWQIMSSGDYHYLVVGDEEGISIDTGYGAGNLREFLEQLGGKPVTKCINTHYHFDHSANNCYFDTVYMAEEDVDRAAIPYPSFEGISFPRDYGVEIVGDRSVIPLKGRELEIFKIGDHTAGGIAILDRKGRFLFTGDELMPGMKNISATVEKLRGDMGKLMTHREEFDTLCGGPSVLPGDTVEIFYEAAGLILDGKLEPTSYRPGPRPQHEEPKEGQPIIYDCQAPHPEDVPKPGMKGLGGPGAMASVEYRGYRFNYHADRIR
ncbi:MAG: MBL fold metallo-hydrolase [Lachnospiraceae bacterium]|nr:MBL fold metallo-hydrolase [Lachnospiraceae bacterium]